MRQSIAIVCSLAGAFLFLSQPVQAEDTTYTAKDSLGNSAFTAIFDAVLGERITAVSSAIGCTITVDEAQKEGSATCSVPLTSIMVDNEPTKTEHFQEWTTNKKSEATECTLELDIPKVSVDRALEAKKSTKFSTEGTFTICGRGREGGEPEAISGSIVYLPPGAYGKNPTLRVRAKIEKFNREEYGISPAATSGWLARVQQLAPVVSAEGTIEVNIFATAPLKETAKKKANSHANKGGASATTGHTCVSKKNAPMAQTIHHSQRGGSHMKIGKGFMVASAVASLVLAGGLTAQAEHHEKSEAVNCAGTNACKGQGSCAGASNSCKAQNECKGQGWTEAESAEACTGAGGTVVTS